MTDGEGRRGEGVEAGSDAEAGTGVVVAFGRQLKLLRIQAGLDRAEFGKRVGYAPQTVASFEQGRRIPQAGFIDRADEVLGAGGVLKALKDEVLRAQYPAFFRDMARLETEAIALHAYANAAVPGLLQTEDYARAVFRMRRPLLDEDTVEQRVAARVARQEIFCRKPMPTLSFVVEESILRRPVGGQGVLREQLEQILLVGHRRNVEIQIMRNDCSEHCGLAGPFTLIETRDERRMAYVEVQRDSRLHSERSAVREIEEQYGILRAQALTPGESLAFIEDLLGVA